jgi:hypothetical protein
MNIQSEYKEHGLASLVRKLKYPVTENFEKNNIDFDIDEVDEITEPDFG